MEELVDEQLFVEFYESAQFAKEIVGGLFVLVPEEDGGDLLVKGVDTAYEADEAVS